TTCKSKVDLPMPGSPPTSVAEPGTNPPPVTRSNSPMPESRRGKFCSVSLLRGTNATRSPLPDFFDFVSPRLLGGPVCKASSTRVFQLPHASQRPVHLE